jgi:hypothetical protein
MKSADFLRVKASKLYVHYGFWGGENEEGTVQKERSKIPHKLVDKTLPSHNTIGTIRPGSK